MIAAIATHDVVVLGGSFAGISISQYLLKHVFPSLPEDEKRRLILVNPSEFFFYKIAAPRMVVRPDLIPLSKITVPIVDGFTQYQTTSFEFIRAYARSVNPSAREIALELANGEGERTIRYDTLVIATGASSVSPLWSPNSTGNETERALEDFQFKLRQAQSIVIAGGGAIGVEVAGELGFELGKKKEIVLYSGADSLLKRVRRDVGQKAEQYLRDLGVRVVHNKLIISEKPSNGNESNLEFSDGTKRTVDLYIDARGICRDMYTITSRIHVQIAWHY
jgi:NADH dehydrogenase FAD-containing subunit